MTTNANTSETPSAGTAGCEWQTDNRTVIATRTEPIKGGLDMRSIHTVRFVIFLAGLLLIAGAGPAFGQGADNCNNAQAIAGAGVFDFDNTAATTDGGNGL